MKYLSPIISLLIVLTIATFPSCLRHDPTPTNLTDLPELTYEGKNTFGCLVNGKEYYNSYEEQLQAYNEGSGLTIEASINAMTLRFELPVYAKGSAHVAIDSTTKDGDGWMSISDYYGTNYASAQTYYSGCDYAFGSESKRSNIARFHIRRYDESVVSGTFSISAADSCGTIEITQGRFDIAYGNRSF